ncbi:hypothetical protein DL98DRAFT_231401 [Cadophora sp. DSE1049]|nr:hypothetical protein DL98DRAFT_231401 [Cadophora sp. DSE1049]
MGERRTRWLNTNRTEDGSKADGIIPSTWNGGYGYLSVGPSVLFRIPKMDGMHGWMHGWVSCIACVRVYLRGLCYYCCLLAGFVFLFLTRIHVLFRPIDWLMAREIDSWVGYSRRRERALRELREKSLAVVG